MTIHILDEELEFFEAENVRFKKNGIGHCSCHRSYSVFFKDGDFGEEKTNSSSNMCISKMG